MMGINNIDALKGNSPEPEPEKDEEESSEDDA